jgi:hypothetical protein
MNKKLSHTDTREPKTTQTKESYKQAMLQLNYKKKPHIEAETKGTITRITTRNQRR